MATTVPMLLDFDPGYYEVMENVFLPRKITSPHAIGTWSRKAVDAAVNMQLDDSDVLMASYPKTGQTWLMTMIHLIHTAKDLEDGKDYDLMGLFDKMPFIELETPDGKTSAESAAELTPPRYLKTHLPYPLWKDNIQKHPELKIIQTIRNPKDTLVSYYHHFRSDGAMGAFHGTWDQYFEWVKAKRLAWGDLFQHTAEWYQFNKNRPNSLVLRYENMKQDHRGHVVKIAKFLGFNLSEKAIDIIVEKSTVKSMSEKHKEVDEHEQSWNSKRSAFIRKGQVGDWVNYFSQKQSAYVEERSKQELDPLGLHFDYTV